MSNATEPAYPVIVDDISTKQFTYSGLTKREYFAGLAMQCLAGKIWGHVNGHDGKGNKWQNCRDALECAALSVKYADALLAELSSNKESGE